MDVSGCGGQVAKVQFYYRGTCRVRITLWDRDPNNPNRFQLADRSSVLTTKLVPRGSGDLPVLASFDVKANDLTMHAADLEQYLGFSQLATSGCDIVAKPVTSAGTIYYQLTNSADYNVRRWKGFAAPKKLQPSISITMAGKEQTKIRSLIN